jgi:hypothetical protein
MAMSEREQIDEIKRELDGVSRSVEAFNRVDARARRRLPRRTEIERDLRAQARAKYGNPIVWGLWTIFSPIVMKAIRELAIEMLDRLKKELEQQR